MKSFWKKENWIIPAFFSVLILPTLLWLLLGLFAPGARDALDHDLGEKREKATAEDGLSAYYEDRMPFRSVLVDTHNKWESSWMDRYQNSVEPVLVRILYGQSDAESMEIAQNSSLFGTADQTDDPARESLPEEPAAEKAPEHVYEETERTEPTCTEPGYVVHTCRECGDSDREELPALGHDYRELAVQEPTYESFGFTDYVCTRCGAGLRDHYVGRLIDATPLPLKTIGKGVIPGRFNWLFYSGNNSLSYYKGTNLLSEEKMAEYMEIAESLNRLCEEQGKQLVIAVWPNKEQVYPEFMPTVEIEDEYKRVERLRDYFAANSDIRFLYPLEELQYAERYFKCYHRYDSHWNHAGAFVGTMAICQALDMEVTDPRDLQIGTGESIWGDYLDLGGLSRDQVPQDLEYYIQYRPDITLGEEVPFAGAMPGVYRTESDSPNDRRLVLIGDSYRNSMVQYLAKDFAHATFAHRDDIAAVEEDLREADVIVLAAVERFDYENFTAAREIIDILSR